ncbi:glycosyltransferase family 2 protein [Solidesulfovibrio sp.]|jgi:glycosyltransferase involved in cell wall biosynthesis|uniref:glycosyltransferase family 2 protein n=1 Tax=Solidesulfovibrio sp. TaxID=2910990 RepID=UPI002B1F730C|nr:glycosyltransferase family 2 protein [Solidesulfovibrio sp.]MEA5089905.1 glycosyltransferase family 2 protein [Solidesulfovibrio sp.]
MARPSICAVTPSYNQGRFIGRTIESVLAQGVDGLEYVVMDGGSTDETVSILERYAVAGKLRYVSERDKGQPDAVNKGIAATSGEVIAWLNSDDVYFSGAFEAVLEVFEKNPEVDVVYGDGDHIDVNDAVIEPYPAEPFDLERLKSRCILCQPAAFFRRRIVERLGALDLRWQYTLDYEFWLRLAKGGAVFAYLPRKLAGSRFYPQTKTSGAKLKVHAEINDMQVATFGRAPDRWLANYAHALVREKWRLREGGPLFTPAVALASLGASLRWNRGVSPALGRAAASWLSRGLLFPDASL